MQLLNVSDRLCVFDDSIPAKTVQKLMTALPPGMYIAIDSTDSVTSIDSVEVVMQTAGIQILRQRRQQKEVVLPKIQKEVMLPVLPPVLQTAAPKKKSGRQIKLPLLQIALPSNVLPFKSKTA